MSNIAQSLRTKPLLPGILTCTLLVSGLALVPVAEAQEAPIRIAVVNLDYIVSQSPAGKALQQSLKSFEDVVVAEVKAKTDKAKDIRQRMVDGANSLTEEKLAELNKQLEDATIDIRRYRDDKEREGQKMQADGLKEIEKQLEPIFEEVRNEGGYDLILNNVPGVVVMVGERAEITQKVLDKLSAKASGS